VVRNFAATSAELSCLLWGEWSTAGLLSMANLLPGQKRVHGTSTVILQADGLPAVFYEIYTKLSGFIPGKKNKLTLIIPSRYKRILT
jgi:hypothetical protein